MYMTIKLKKLAVQYWCWRGLYCTELNKILEGIKFGFLLLFILGVGSSVSSTEKDIDTQLTKTWTAIDKLSIIWKSNLTNKMKRSFFQAAVVSILLYGCTTWTLTKQLEKKLDGNYTRIIQVRRTRHCWRSRDELISDILLWTPTYGWAKAGQPARTYIQQVCEDTGCSPEDLPEAINDREKWRERVRNIRASSMTWLYRTRGTSVGSRLYGTRSKILK